MTEDWENLWKRAKKEAKIKLRNLWQQDDFPSNYRTPDEVLT
jgi:hypothetical protein